MLSMFLYALEHALSPWGIVLYMIWALALSLSYIKTKKCVYGNAAHFICNVLINGFAVVRICEFCSKNSLEVGSRGLLMRKSEKLADGIRNLCED